MSIPSTDKAFHSQEQTTSLPAKESNEPISRQLIDDVCARLAADKPVRQMLPGGGQLYIERLLPFLCVYRRNPTRQDAGTQLFVNHEASFLIAPGSAPVRKGLSSLIRRIAATAAERLGGFLLLEIWSADDAAVPKEIDAVTGEIVLPGAAFRIATRQPHRPGGSVTTLEYSLQQIQFHSQPAKVVFDFTRSNHPPKMTQLLAVADADRLKCHVLGLEIRPVYRHPQTGEVYPEILRLLRRRVSLSLKKCFFRYTLNRTRLRPQHFFSLGRKTLPKQVWTVDRQLAEVSGQFKFLLQVTPVNMERAWHEFQACGFQKEPLLEYRPLETNPLLLKRRLSRIGTERVEDPTLAHLLFQTQDELDRQITMLSDVGSTKFLPGSLQVFGAVEPPLLDLAKQILERIPPTRKVATDEVDAGTFVQRASQEIEWYRRQMPGFAAKALIRKDMYSGLLSTGGNLLVGRETVIPARRVDALLQHEVGTHLVTYYNGKSQPMRLLQVGLAGYDGLQEGLAVLSEYLVGGLNRSRLRTLAARVLAADCVVRGASFVDTYRLLADTHSFEPHTAYTIVARVYRGGGLTKDAVYLRGLVEIVDFIRRGGDLDLLLVGKLAADHIPIVRELLHRGVLRTPPLRPRYLDTPETPMRLAKVREASSVLDLVEPSS